MVTLDEKQVETAKKLVRQVKGLQPDQRALWSLTGEVGSGKTSVLRRVEEQFRLENLIPLTISAPAGELDAGPIALLETARQLKDNGFLNGEMNIISDPKKPWAQKMAAVTDAVNRYHRDIVILCDEPRRWWHDDDPPDYGARSFAEWIENTARCRRIITGWIKINPAERRTRVPSLDDGRDLLAIVADWDVLWDCASRLRDSLPAPVRDRPVWETKLCVALCAVLPVDKVVRLWMSGAKANQILEQLLDRLEEQLEYRDFCATLSRLALARTDLNKPVLAELTVDLEPSRRGVVEKCLFHWDHDRAALHPAVRQELLARARDPRRIEPSSPWRLSRDDRMAIHDRLASEYSLVGNSQLRDFVESLHHGLLGANASRFQESDPRLQFVEQLDEIGRTLSFVHGEHTRAASIFRLAVGLDSEHAYSHHYLAFNLDWLAEESTEVELHYKKAIELQPTHPWWWSRWISYLATRGRSGEAQLYWRAAVDAMNISEDGTPPWIFLSLHRWVARWLLHWAELDFAEEVLCAIPKRLAENDARIRTLWNLLRALRQAERGVSVFPLTVSAKDWWSPSPHTDLPPSWEALPLRYWIPARVERVDRENSVAVLIAAKRPPTKAAHPEYFEMELRREKLTAAAHGFAWADLREGRFVELGFYGEGEDRMRVGLHRDTNWNDPHLLSLVPPPDRWYRRAVDGAWQENAEID